MKRISISFYDEVYEQLEQIMKEDDLQTIAQCVRKLIELAIRVRLATKERVKNDEEEVLAIITELRNLFKNNLIWSLETRLLTRHLVGNLPHDNEEQKVENLEKYRNSAINYVQGLYGEKIE